MKSILSLSEIKNVLKNVDLFPIIEQGFVALSEGNVVIPPIGEMVFTNPPGDVHIKYGHVLCDDFYVIKVASGFYENWKLNLPNSNGLMLIFKKSTGELESILLDEGYLTDVRTAIAGAISVKYLAPSVTHKIGVIGCGTQARHQLEWISKVNDCRNVIVFGRDAQKVNEFIQEIARFGFHGLAVKKPMDILHESSVIITTTPSKEALLYLDEPIAHDVHITAVGADSHDKSEIDVSLLQQADLLVADSKFQCLDRGELRKIKHDVRKCEQIVELGSIISGEHPGREKKNKIIISDLTGVAVQDIQIAKVVAGQI